MPRMPRMPKIPKIMKGGNFAATAPATMPGGMPGMPGSVPLNYNTLMSNTMPGMPVNFQQLSQNIPIESKKGPDYILIGIIILFALIIGFSLYDTFSSKAANCLFHKMCRALIYLLGDEDIENTYTFAAVLQQIGISVNG